MADSVKRSFISQKPLKWIRHKYLPRLFLNYNSHCTVWHCGWMYVVKQCNNRVICRWLLKCHFQFAMNAWQLFAPSISSLSPPCCPQTTCLINILNWISVFLKKTLIQYFSFALFFFCISRNVTINLTLNIVSVRVIVLSSMFIL